ncbi:hypothetical protein KIW84_011529 [Lathyrus oleraceus]|uniref:NOMO second beta-sandwich domain-containing protein n=1 Tax=Pisum sativum TaxID=3888 RepID=A0A9D5BF56_PEA|nr:hypothetical protein KIW84_011529 [Pisum sativum]
MDEDIWFCTTYHGRTGKEEYRGFSISGRVVGAAGGESCSVKNGGPSNVEVELLSPSGDLVSSVLTSSSGSYLFTNVIPGKYELQASNPDIKVEVKGSTQVELGFGNGVIDDISFVPGYSISGYVVSQGNLILGVHIFLYSKDVSEIKCLQGSAHGPRQEAALCHVFPTTRVNGFSVGGRVVVGNDMGVEGVMVIVDGHERSITNNQGYYKLDQVTSTHYTIKVRKEHYKFKKLEKYMVLPNMASIEDIVVVSYDIYGLVRMVSSSQKAKVALTHGPDNVKP